MRRAICAAGRRPTASSYLGLKLRDRRRFAALLARVIADLASRSAHVALEDGRGDLGGRLGYAVFALGEGPFGAYGCGKAASPPNGVPACVKLAEASPIAAIPITTLFAVKGRSPGRAEVPLWRTVRRRPNERQPFSSSLMKIAFPSDRGALRPGIGVRRSIELNDVQYVEDGSPAKTWLVIAKNTGTTIGGADVGRLNASPFPLD